ncbi:MAG: glycogen/starch/alpha-glucan phosphorylase, partial [Actinomyces sp.]|nr:glycogen/starch/alpha-glucan phosphorylase [Actinomyces sp.]
DLRWALLESGYGPADVYYVLGDFASYRETKDRMAQDYRDQEAWSRKAWINITRSGRFSSDRTISDYAREVWHINAEPIA